MKNCMNFNDFKRFIHATDKEVAIDRDKDKKLRFNVWETTPEHIKNLFEGKGIDAELEKDASLHVLSKIERALQRINESTKPAAEFKKKILDSEYNIELSIAMHELIESVKGEADKARNMGIEITKVSPDGILPALPRSRLAASIGRKIAFQKGYRFKSFKENPATPVEIETLYATLGENALQGLVDKGYAEFHTELPTIKDYLTRAELKKEKLRKELTTTNALSVSLKSDVLGVKENSQEAHYFLKRSSADLYETELGTITDMLRVVRQVTQPSTIVLPDTKATMSKEDLRDLDDPNVYLSDTLEDAREKLYKAPLYVHDSLHGLFQELNKEVMRTGKSATSLVTKAFGIKKSMLNSLFGLKQSDDYSIDKKESVSGQNLSKTTPFDDLAEYYDVLQDGADSPVPLHMALKGGRNARLYYHNSILNPHGSKHSRYMLTGGSYEVQTKEDIAYLIYNISQALGQEDLGYSDFTGDTKSLLDKALVYYEGYQNAKNLNSKLAHLDHLATVLPGVNYVTLLTSLQAIKDIRNPVDGVIRTQFTVSADATASGGTLTLLQALGTKPSVLSFLMDIGLLTDTKGGVNQIIPDIYYIMTKAVKQFIAGEVDLEVFSPNIDTDPTRVKELLQDTLDMLYPKDKEARDFSKGPTMTFVYGQGPTGATETIARTLADRIIDDLGNQKTRDYLARLMEKPRYASERGVELKNIEGLYKEIVQKLKDEKLPLQLYSIMDSAINQKYLAEYKERANRLYELIKKVPNKTPIKILPAGAVLEGKTKADIKKYGMPLSKVFEVASDVPFSDGQQVLTWRQKNQKTVMDVSPIHGIDAAQLYHTLNNILGDSGLYGAVVVHDDVRSKVQTVREAETGYAENTKAIAESYDLHEQVLNSLEVYFPEITKTAEFKSLSAEVRATVQAKKDIIKNQFNERTNALIGDGDAFKEFAGIDLGSKEPTPPRKETPAKPESPSLVGSFEQKKGAEAVSEAPAKPEVGAAAAERKSAEEKVTAEAEEKVETAKKEEKVEVDAETEVKEEAETYRKAYEERMGSENDKNTHKPDSRKETLQYLNHAVASMLTSRVEREGAKLSHKLHTLMSDNFPLYTDVANKLRGVYDSSEALQQLVHTVTNWDIDKDMKADVLAQMAEITGQQTAVTNAQLSKFHKIMVNMSDQEKADTYQLVNDMPLHDYFVLTPTLKNEKDISEEVRVLEEKLPTQAIKDVNGLVAWNVRGEYGTAIYNLEARYPMEDSKFGEDVRKLLALKSIQAIGVGKLETFLENTDLADLVRDQVVANRLSTLHNKGTSNLRDSLIPEHYKEPMQREVIELKDLSKYEYEDRTGWKILRRPTQDTLGIVYRPIIDATNITGAFTDIKLLNTDIDVDKKWARQKDVVATDKGHKLLLTKEEKQILGLDEDFSQGLVRGTAHSMAIQDSQIIRDKVLQKETRMFVDEKAPQKLIDIINSETHDNPWFLKLDDSLSYSQLDPAIRAKYAPVAGRASNVKGFNEEVSLVRKDISHWLLGGSSSSLFQNPKMQWTMRIVKDLVAGAKIGMVILNPIKIAKDNASNISYLGMSGVSPTFIAKNYRDITQDFHSYNELQRQIIQLKVQLVARPESTKLKKKIKSLQDQVKRNPLGDLNEKGFVNSLGSDLVARNSDTTAGLQADMHTALEYLLINRKGNKNYLGHFISQFSKLGFDGETFLTYLGSIAGRTDTGKGMEKSLDQVAERIQEIKSDDDVINYVTQFTNSPGSEAVRVGSNLTDLTDVLAKETLYRHLVENEGMTPKSARIQVLDSFPDYKENLPLAVKQLSDVGIIMFPSFWLRIQKVIYRLARDKPVNLASELMLEEILDTDFETILGSNIITKSTTYGGIIHSPLEPMGAGSVLPTHLWG